MRNKISEALAIFSRTHLELSESIDRMIMGHETQSPNSAIDESFISTILWYFHSLKSGAILFDMQLLLDVSLNTENFLLFLKKNRMAVEPQHLKTLIKSCCFSITFLKDFANSRELKNLEQESNAIVSELLLEQDRINKKILLERINAPRDFRNFSASRQISTLPVPEIIPEFFQSAREIFMEIESNISDIENDTSDKKSYEKAMKNLHTFTGLSNLFDLQMLSGISRLSEIIIFYYIKNPSPVKISPLFALKNALNLMVSSLNQIETEAEQKNAPRSKI
ncbi:MAG: hypothetical protein HQM10_18810 [Candidatus Riflebacteria bacterium]|nr:hypothetical protein [Candidatus Riflebacteria bacterium]